MENKKRRTDGDMGQMGLVNEVLLDVDEDENMGNEQESPIDIQNQKKDQRRVSKEVLAYHHEYY